MAVLESKNKKTVGYHQGEVKTVISVEDVNRQAQQLGSGVSEETINKLIKDEPFLKIENLRAGYGKMEILHDFTLKISKGESLCLIGPNGAGKSTLVNIISGVFKQSKGEYRINNKLTSFLSPMEAMKVGISTVYQNLAIIPILNIYRNFFLVKEPKKGGLFKTLDKDFAINTTIEELNKIDINN